MEDMVYNYIQGLSEVQINVIEALILSLGIILILIGIHFFVTDTVEWIKLVKNPRVSTFATVHMYFTFYLPMFIFFLVDDSTVATFVGSLLLFAVAYMWIVWLRIGRYSENWSALRPFVTYIKAQDHVCMLVIGSAFIRTVLFYIKFGIG
ncbi:hypothetical protein [Enterococcus phage phiSHEF13]|uniref:Uncharacterized protein n=1 Tax=Enterococcus phage phiSHEF13 TaxID=2918648 RepID=A0AAE9FNK6_9CAUD|nr:hypothetical protein [Enterococcus phage phiSHEF13]